MTSITPTPSVGTETGEPAPRPRRSWLWAVLALVVVLGALAAAVWLLPVSTATQNEAFDDDIGQLVIEVTGSVTLVAGDHTELTIGKEWVLGREPTVEMTNEGGLVRVNGQCFWLAIRCDTNVSGTVASDAVIEVRTSAGAVEVRGATNGVDLETSAGSVQATDVTGPARLITSAGNVVGTITDGNVEAETSAGRIDLTVLGDFSSVSASTSAGDVDLTVTDDVYDVDADTSAGSVSIGVRTDPSAARQIFADSSAGSITIKPAP
ncbi:MAG TPA: DUF4097 family beta strand repeat-containing protein [Acidimicrobiia bacterium]